MLADLLANHIAIATELHKPCATGSASCPTLLEPALNKPTTRAALLPTLAWDPDLVEHFALVHRACLVEPLPRLD